VAAPGSYQPDALVPAVVLAAAAAVPSVVYLASGHLVFASGRTGWLAVSTPLSVACGLVWAVLLAPHWGMVAIGSGYLVAYLLLTMATTLVQRGVSPTPWRPPLLPVVTVAWLATTVLGALLPAAGPGAAVRVLGVLVLAGGLLARLRRRPRPPISHTRSASPTTGTSAGA